MPLNRISHIFIVLSLIILIHDCDTAKIGVYFSTLSNSQVIFGKQLAEVLAADGHEVVVIRPLLNTAATLKSGFREIRLETLISQPEAFVEFSHVEHRVIFEEPSISAFKDLGAAFTNLNNATCHEQIGNVDFMRAIKAEKFDLMYINHHFNCALAVARRAGVRYVRFSSAVLGRGLAAPAGLWPWPSMVPEWLSPYNDQMTYKERGVNMLLSALAMLEELAYSRLDNLYRSHYGANFPSARQLAEDVELALVNDEEFFNYPRPVSHKIVYIGGLGQEDINSPSTAEIEDYIKFIGDAPAVLVSLGSVADSSKMPRAWKEAFVQLFELLPHIRFIWKYDGSDVETPSNVLVRKWLPQNALLRSSKLSLFVTHGGYNSLAESLYSGTRALFIPLFADQFRNAELARTRGTGEVITKAELSGLRLAERVEHLLANQSYADAATHYRRLLLAKPFKARELVTRWNRFLLEHHVNLNIRSLNFFQQYSLDIIIPTLLVIIFVLFAFFYGFYRLIALYYWSCFVMGKSRVVHRKRD